MNKFDKATYIDMKETLCFYDLEVIKESLENELQLVSEEQTRLYNKVQRIDRTLDRIKKKIDEANKG